MSDESRQNILNRLRIQKDLEKFTAGALARHPNLEELIAAIAALERDEQDQIYRSAELVARTNNELAAQFIAKAPAAFHAMGGDGVQEWLDGAIQVFDHRGLGFAVDFLEDIDSFAEAYAGRHAQCMFDQASVFLRHFVRGLGGRELRIATDEDTYTDTEGLYLPASFNVFPDAEQNFTLYKLTAVHLWAQTWYGTWRYQVLEKLMRHFDTDKVLPIFNRLECIRLDACLARELPGVDIVAAADAIPLVPGAVEEIAAAHLIERFPQEELERAVLPHWRALLRDGGTLRLVASDADAMTQGFAERSYPFADLREALYGGLDRDGELHRNVFTPESCAELLAAAGFVDARVIERGRRNGRRLEFELVARKAAAMPAALAS